MLSKSVVSVVQAVRSASSASSKFTVRDFKLHRLTYGPSTLVELERNDGLHYYRQMQVMRTMEEAIGVLTKKDHIRGYCHQYIGEEACGAGTRAAMDEGDALITSFRCHAHTYLLGASPAEIIAELMGRASGVTNGKGGSMHMYLKNYYGGNGIVGAQIALGTGIALAQKYEGEPNVCFTLYGDGASNQGQFYESANMAELWKLPVVYVCENNKYAMGTAATRSTVDREYYKKGDRIPGIWVDGMDVLAVREAMKFAKAHIAAGHGPIVVELDTYRFVPHGVKDPDAYMNKEELLEEERYHDPIHILHDKLLASGLATEPELKKIEKEVKEEIDAAVKQSFDGKFLPREGIFTDIYHNTPPIRVRGALAQDTLVQPFTTTEELLKRASI